MLTAGRCQSALHRAPFFPHVFSAVALCARLAKRGRPKVSSSVSNWLWVNNRSPKWTLMETWTKTRGPIPGRLILTHAQLFVASQLGPKPHFLHMQLRIAQVPARWHWHASLAQLLKVSGRLSQSMPKSGLGSRQLPFKPIQQGTSHYLSHSGPYCISFSLTGLGELFWRLRVVPIHQNTTKPPIQTTN